MAGGLDDDEGDTGSDASSFVGYACPRSVPHSARLLHLLISEADGTAYSIRTFWEDHPGSVELLGVRSVKHWRDVIKRFYEVSEAVPHLAVLGEQLHGLDVRATLYEVLCALGAIWYAVAVQIANLAQVVLVSLLDQGYHMSEWPQPMSALLQSGANLLRADDCGRVPLAIAARCEAPSNALPEIARRAPHALILPDSEGATPLSTVDGLPPSSTSGAAGEILARAALDCAVSHPDATRQLLARCRAAEAGWRQLAAGQGCAPLLLACCSGSSSQEEMGRIADDADVQESQSAEKLQQGLCRVSLLRALTAERGVHVAELEPEELRLQLLHLEAKLRQKEDDHRQAMASLQDELDRAKTMLQERDREILALQAGSARKAGAEGEVPTPAPRPAVTPYPATLPAPRPMEERPAEARAAAGSKGKGSKKKAKQGVGGHPLSLTEHQVVEDIRRSRCVGMDAADVPGELRQGIGEMRASLTAAVGRLTHDLYESEVHFVQELLQNADDNTFGSDVVPCMSIHLCTSGSRSYFYSTNNEVGLTEKDVRAICDIARSSKQPTGNTTTGCKGIGFKAVFRVCNEPHVLSNGWRFKFSGEGLGMLTPQWLDDADCAALPDEVQIAYNAGRTVIYLPLARPGAAEGIEAEMRTMQADAAQLLFLRRLREVTLHFSGGTEVHLEALLGVGGARAATLCDLGAGAAADAGSATTTTHFQMGMHDDVSVALPLTDKPLAQRIYSFLPVRAVGFHFAVQAPFNTTASRTDFHRTPENARRRDAIAPAFLSACSANQGVANRALKYLGHEPVEPFWRAAWLDIVLGLGNVPCVQTLRDGLQEPYKCLVRGDDPSAKWISDALLHDVCGLYFAAPSNPKDLLQHLGVQPFGIEQLCAIVVHQGGELLERMWDDPARSAFFSDLYSSFFDALQGDPALVESLFPLAIFPVPSVGRSRQVPEFRAVSGLFLNFAADIPIMWQELLVPVLSKDLDLSRRALSLLTALHVEDLDVATLEEAALRAVLKPKSFSRDGADAIRIMWAGLSVLFRTFAQGRSLSLSWSELGAALALPSDTAAFVPARQLRMRSCLGVERLLPECLSEHICAFVGAAAVPSQPLGAADRVMRPPLDALDSARLFEWEVFLWALGCQPGSLRSRSTAESIELTLKLGAVLVDGCFWQRALQLPRAMEYVHCVLDANNWMRVNCWLRRLPVFIGDRCVDVRDLFLYDAFHTLGGSHLDYVANVPANKEVYEHLQRLGVSVRVNRGSLRKCVRILRERGLEDIGLVADLYTRLHAVGFQPQPEEPFIFLPGARGGRSSFVPPGKCSWYPLEDRLLQRCCTLHSLQEHYSRFGPEVCTALQRWVRASPADDVEALCETLVTAVSMGKAGFSSRGIADLLADGGQVPSRDAIAQALVAACRAAGGKLAQFCVTPGGLLLDGGEDPFGAASVIRRYFAKQALIVVPGRAQEHYVRVLRVREAYWCVDPELADHPCAAWALSATYGMGESAEVMKQFFTQVLGIRYSFTRADLGMRMVAPPPPTGEEFPQGPGMVEEGLDFRHGPVLHPRSRQQQQQPHNQSVSLRTLHFDEPPQSRALGCRQPHRNGDWQQPPSMPPQSGPPMAPHMGPPSRSAPASSSWGRPQHEDPAGGRPLPPRSWRIVGRLWTWNIVSTGDPPPIDFSSFDTRPLLRAMVLFGAMPPQVAFAYDPSGRCVCDQELLLDVHAAERAMDIADPDTAASFWALELSHAIAHQVAGPQVNHRFLQTYRDTILGFFPRLL